MSFHAEVHQATFDLGMFRHAVARYCRLLVRSRWQCDPGFLTQNDLAAWALDNIDQDRWPAWKLLAQAAEVLAHLNLAYLPRCGSGGVRETDETTPTGRLISAVSFLAQTEGGGPTHNEALVEAARKLRKGEPVDWDDLVAWDQLGEIRADLDQLPHPQRDTNTARLDRIEGLLTSLVEREQIKDFYSTEEFARLMGKAEFTVREWCRLGRIRAIKKGSGRGKHQAWAIAHEELLRYRKEGLLPLPRSATQG